MSLRVFKEPKINNSNFLQKKPKYFKYPPNIGYDPWLNLYHRVVRSSPMGYYHK
jgi:hypothetical protein